MISLVDIGENVMNANIKQHKTPLRYPGGKSRAMKYLEEYFPHVGNMKEYYEPFLGGGSVAIFVTKKFPHLRMRVNDLFVPLYQFWDNLQNNTKELHQGVMDFRLTNNTPDSIKENIAEYRKIIRSSETSSLDRAIYWYIINKCSFGGLGLSGGFSESSSISNFTIKIIDDLLVYSQIISNWEITNYSYETVMEEANEDSFVYLDPPYDLDKQNSSGLYGDNGSMHNKFDHVLFAENCLKCPAKQLVSYNNEQEIIDRYPNWNANTYDLTYTMRSVAEYGQMQKDRKELVLYNYDILNRF